MAEIPLEASFQLPCTQTDVIPPGQFSAGHLVEAITLEELPRYRDILLSGILGMPYASEAGKKKDVETRTVDYYKEALAKPEEWALLAAKNPVGLIVGALEARIEIVGGQRAGYIHWVVADVGHRKQGVAGDLYKGYEAQMRARGDVPYLLAHVHNANIPSLALHRSLGISNVFAEREDGRGKWYYKHIGAS